MGRNYITLDDIPLIIKTALDTAPIERVSLFSLLIANNGIYWIRLILESLNVARKIALRTMAEFKAIGLVDIEEETKHEGAGRPQKRLVLNPRFDWSLSDELITKIIPHTTTIFIHYIRANNYYDNSSTKGTRLHSHSFPRTRWTQTMWYLKIYRGFKV